MTHLMLAPLSLHSSDKSHAKVCKHDMQASAHALSDAVKHDILPEMKQKIRVYDRVQESRQGSRASPRQYTAVAARRTAA